MGKSDKSLIDFLAQKLKWQKAEFFMYFIFSKYSLLEELKKKNLSFSYFYDEPYFTKLK